MMIDVFTATVIMSLGVVVVAGIAYLLAIRD